MRDEAYVRAMIALQRKLERPSQTLDAILDAVCESPKLRALIDARIFDAIRALNLPCSVDSCARNCGTHPHVSAHEAKSEVSKPDEPKKPLVANDHITELLLSKALREGRADSGDIVAYGDRRAYEAASEAREKALDEAVTIVWGERPKVEAVATHLDVHVDGVCVGWVVDRGDCWRAHMYDDRQPTHIPNCSNMDEAIQAVVDAANGGGK